MKFKTMTEPFNGTEINVLEFEDGSILFDIAFEGESCSMPYNKELDAYMIPASLFKHRDVVTLTQAANILSVSKTRVSKLCAKNQIKNHKVCGAVLVDWNSLDSYKYGKFQNDDENTNEKDEK